MSGVKGKEEVGLRTWNGHTSLALVFAAAVCIADCAALVTFGKQNLCAAFASIDLDGQWGGVRELERHLTVPFGFERRAIHDDATASVGRLADADRQGIARNIEVFQRMSQCEAVRRDDAVVAFVVHEGSFIKVLGIDNDVVLARVVREDLELTTTANIVTITGQTITDDTFAFGVGPDLVRNKRLDHGMFPHGWSVEGVYEFVVTRKRWNFLFADLQDLGVEFRATEASDGDIGEEGHN